MSDLQDPSKPSNRTGHEGHCFIVMPFGRTPSEIRWFRGWYEQVIKPAVIAAEFMPILAATEDTPSAINDEIRTHLACDPMVVVDLGGATPDDIPNPNVMYELGIRHAFGLPLVMMAWEGQRLPFDVNNQRAILSSRDFLEIDPTRRKLEAFIRSAKEGRYYRPMEAVGREAQIDAATATLGEDSLLKALAEEIRQIKQGLAKPTVSRLRKHANATQIRHFLSKRTKSAVQTALLERGIPHNRLKEVFDVRIPPELAAEAMSWSKEDWITYSLMLAHKLLGDDDGITALPINVPRKKVTPELLIRVSNLLPAQPWPTGVHRMVAQTLGVSNAVATSAITELIRQGKYFPQINGSVYYPEERPRAKENVEQSLASEPVAASASNGEITSSNR
jgi:hypothetical protein